MDWYAVATVASPIISGIVGVFMFFLKRTMNAHKQLDVEVKEKVEHVIVQNKVQEIKIEEVHAIVNSRLTEYLKIAIQEALARGIQEGIELERIKTTVTKGGKNA